ncbi:sensor histidine kinase [Oceanobacillus saliphilus]|uniref:sensor histidine kinase n=1 Tax=Oceanobacillus saliphilus TaxID=2925834 RepID=UPI00201D91A2|nr:sensor histidine kinase [Oceanobacillus saliphilus]
MIELLFLMVERLGIIVMLAFLLTRLPFFRNLISLRQLNRKQEWTAILFFGVFGIIGTYSGFVFNVDTFTVERWGFLVTPDEAVANFRVIGVAIAGLLGGYRVGIGAGLIAGIHRLLLGGYTALSCGIATILTGFFTGYFSKKGENISYSKAFLLTACAEALQMLLILLLSRPLDKAILLVENIAIPMILANGVGAVLFMIIIKSVINSEEKLGASQAQHALKIADKTLVHLRNGLNETSAENVCEILYRKMNPFAVSITDDTKILAHIGAGSDHHKKGAPIQTQATKNAIQNGEVVIASEKDIRCINENCPLHAVILAPLKLHGKNIGIIKFYYHSEKEIRLSTKELVTGLSILLSNQLETAEANRALALAKEAEINALQAQINPHFLFNTLNTISSLIRINPKNARKLLLSLSQFLRHNVSSTIGTETTIEQELSHVKTYLNIEEMRFSHRLKIAYDVDHDILHEKISPLTLQPILENSIKHGLRNKNRGGYIKLKIKDRGDYVFVSVADNGEGMSNERLKIVGTKVVSSNSGTGMALYNVNRRLTIMFGNASELHIKSKKQEGTEVSFTVPKKVK